MNSKTVCSKAPGQQDRLMVPKEYLQVTFYIRKKGGNESFTVENSGSKSFIHVLKLDITNSTEYPPAKHSPEDI